MNNLSNKEKAKFLADQLTPSQDYFKHGFEEGARIALNAENGGDDIDSFDKLDENRNLVARLEEYSEMEGTELGELCGLLCNMFSYTDYMVDNGFAKHLIKEIKLQLKRFEEEYEIDEVEEEPRSPRKYKELRWKGDE